MFPEYRSTDALLKVVKQGGRSPLFPRGSKNARALAEWVGANLGYPPTPAPR